MKSKLIKAVIFGILAMCVCCPGALAGNKWMMEKMGQNLIKLNSEVVKKIVGTENNAQISLKAKVVYDNGKQLIMIEDVDVSSSEKKPDDIFHPAPVEYETYVSYQALDIPGSAAAPGQPSVTTGTMVLDIIDLEALMEKHPEGQVIKLQKNEINAINWGSRKKPDNVYLFFW